MPLTAQKLRLRIAELGRAAIAQGTSIAPIFVTPASGPMAPPPAEDECWKELEQGQLWGEAHSTSWLKTRLQAPAQVVGQCAVLLLHWDTGQKDNLFRLLEATAFLDGNAIGGFDWRHRTLVLP